MAFNVKKGNENKSKERVCMDIKSMGYEVTNVRVITDSFIAFTLKFKGFALYNMRVIESKKTGDPFISVPRVRGQTAVIIISMPYISRTKISRC